MAPNQQESDVKFILQEIFDQIRGLREDLKTNYATKEALDNVKEDIKDLKDKDKTKLTSAATLISIVSVILNIILAAKSLHLF